MVEDETLRSEVERHVMIDKLCAEWALSNVIGEMAGLLGAIYDYKLEQSGLTIKFPVERLFHVDGTPREAFVPRR